MKTKKYYAPTPYEAFKQIRADLGEEAIILHSAKVTQPGLRGLLGGTAYEVIAGVGTLDDEVSGTCADQSVRRPPTDGGPRYTADSFLVSELEDIRVSLRQVLETVHRSNGKRNGENHNGSNHNRRLGCRSSPQLTRLRDLLIWQGIDAQAAYEIVKKVDFELSGNALQNWANVMDAAARELERRFPSVDAMEARNGHPIAIFVVGSAGVGKTTTVAKLGATYAATKRVSLVTIDNLRVGSLPQLQMYAEILGIPLRAAYSPDELAESVIDFSDADVVLVDTPACGPTGFAKESLQEFVRAVDRLEIGSPEVDHGGNDLAAHGRSIVLLATSATTKEDDAIRTLGKLDGLPLRGLIITKLDETIRYGSLFNLVRRSGLPVAYVTTGQNVPRDIQLADARAMAVRLLGAEKQIGRRC